MDCLPPVHTRTAHLTPNLAMCPAWGANPQTSAVWDDAPTNWTTQPGLFKTFLTDFLVSTRLETIVYSSSPQPFWHQGLVSWKTVCLGTGGGGMASGWFKHITFKFTSCCAARFLGQHWSAALMLGTPGLQSSRTLFVSIKHTNLII